MPATGVEPRLTHGAPNSRNREIGAYVNEVSAASPETHVRRADRMRLTSGSLISCADTSDTRTSAQQKVRGPVRSRSLGWGWQSPVFVMLCGSERSIT